MPLPTASSDNQPSPAHDPEVRLPDIALSDLPESTKDFLIAFSATGKPVTEVLRDVLNAAAAAAGFNPNKAA